MSRTQSMQCEMGAVGPSSARVATTHPADGTVATLTVYGGEKGTLQ